MLIGLLGGTFDPIHNGHLHVATQLLQQLPLDEVRLLPCYQPVHRGQPIAGPEDRLAMAELACAAYPKITVDTHEMKRQGPSYMIDTLKELHRDNPKNHWCLILGQDAFQHFHTWHQWEEILNYCHLIIVNRPEASIHYPEAINHLLSQHQTLEITTLSTRTHGALYFCTVPPLAISATHLRQQLPQHRVANNTLPDKVLEYIQEHKLYS